MQRNRMVGPGTGAMGHEWTISYRRPRGLSGIGVMVFCLVVAIAAVPAAYGQTNMVANGSFELDGLPGPVGITSSFTSWSATGGTLRNGNALQAYYHTDQNGAVPNGVQLAGIQGGGTLSQTLTGLTDGAMCTLSFYVCKRGDGNGNIDFKVSLGSQTLWGNTTLTYVTFALQTVNFVYNAAWGNNLVLTVSNAVGDSTALFDNVVLNASLSYWPFDIAGNTQGWAAVNQIAGGYSVAGGLLSYDITAGATDPMWDIAPLALPRASYSWLKVKAKNQTSANEGRLFWNFGSGLTGEQSQGYALNPNDTQVSEYWANLAERGTYWTSGATITELRFDLPNGSFPITGTHFDVDEVKLSASGPPAPEVASIVRYSPATAPPTYTNSGTLTWDVRVNHSMASIATNNFTCTGTGTAAGTVTTVTPLGATWCRVTASVSGTGTLRLDGATGGSGLDVANQAISTSYTGGQSYNVDQNAPNPGTPTPPADAKASPIAFNYSGAGDGGSGLASVKLWYKKGSGGTWTDSGLTQTGASGSFSFTGMTGDATYYFGLQATDTLGNSSAQPSGSGQGSTVYDTTPPTAPSVSGAALTSNPRPTWSWTPGGGGNGTYRWDLDGSGWTETTALSFTPGGDLSGGTHRLSVQERDDVGNWSGSGFFDIFLDLAPPVISVCPAPQSGECPATVANFVAGVTAQDNFTAPANLVITQSPAAGTPVGLGPHTVTITVTDQVNHQSTCETTFTSSDTVAPVITLAGSATVTVECSGTYSDAGATALDECAGSPAVTTGGSVNTGVPGAYTLTYSATDGTNAAAEVTRVVTVSDSTAPVITACAPDQTVTLDNHCEAFVPDFTAHVSASDACDTNPAVVQSPTAGTPVLVGETVVTLTVTDDASNSVTCTAKLTVLAGACSTTVPNVVGLSQTAAEAALSNADLVVGRLSSHCGDADIPGMVVGQVPAASDDPVLSNSAVNLVVSQGRCYSGECPAP